MTRSVDEEHIVLTPVETAILLALALGPMSGYELVQQVKEDSRERISLSNGTTYAALKRMIASDYMEPANSVGINPGRPRHVYRLTRNGRMVLGFEVSAARRMIHLADERL